MICCKAHTVEEVEQLALDRTTEYRSASIGYSRLLTEDLQLNLDVTATRHIRNSGLGWRSRTSAPAEPNSIIRRSSSPATS